MKEVRLRLRVLTPMFLGGADPSRCELRGASVRGQLRFWWRAQHGALSLKELREKEGQIFGFVGKEGNRRSSFAVVVEEINLQHSRDPLSSTDYTSIIIQRSSGRTVRANLLEYLAYGTYKWDATKKKNVLTRDYVKPDSTFWLGLRIREEKHLHDLAKALRAFILFGALGAKARNGYGSFEVLSVEGAEEALAGRVPDETVMRELCSVDAVPPFSAFCIKARLFRTRKCYHCWEACLAALARVWREARLSLEDRHVYNSRQYLGAPIVVAGETVSRINRRAKPYFLRVHRESEGYRGYILYLPSRYLPPQYHKRLGIIDSEMYPSQLHEYENSFGEVCERVNTKLSEMLEVVFCPRS